MKDRSLVRLVGPFALLVATCLGMSACTVSAPEDAGASEPPTSTVSSTSNTSTTSTPASPSTSITSTTTTAPISPLRLAFVGDTGTGGEQQNQVAELIEAADAERDFDWLVIVGDMIYEVGDPTLVEEVVLGPYSGTLDDKTALAPVLGNHDVKSGAGDEIMAKLGSPDRWYSVGNERLLLVVLDSTRPFDEDQFEFLKTTLADSTSDWIVVALHHPPFSAGEHGSNSAIRGFFVPIFERYGVDVVFTGHEHDYQRSRPIDGITYVVTGAGAKLRPTGCLMFTEVSASVPHFVTLDVLPGSLTIEAIAEHGIIDRVRLTSDNRGPFTDVSPCTPWSPRVPADSHFEP